jgi:hypothetical protein
MATTRLGRVGERDWLIGLPGSVLECRRSSVFLEVGALGRSPRSGTSPKFSFARSQGLSGNLVFPGLVPCAV